MVWARGTAGRRRGAKRPPQACASGVRLLPELPSPKSSTAISAAARGTGARPGR
jgi:hypothetical protein